MRRISLTLLLLALAVVAAGCDIFSSEQPTDQSQPPAQPAAPVTGGQSTVLPPAGACQSRLWGKLVFASGQPKPNTQVDIVSSTFRAKTTADANGLYGFAGLCAGEYSISVTPPGGQPQPAPNKVALDGSKQVKVDLQVK